jgi:hypothetical protein
MELTVHYPAKMAALAVMVVLVLPGGLEAVVARALAASTALGAMGAMGATVARLVTAETVPLEE